MNKVRTFQTKKMRWYALIGVMAFMCSACFTPQPAYTPTPAGTTDGGGFHAPDFSLPALDGRPVSLSDLRGQVVLLNFWATWCVPCRKEMPELQAAYQAYRDQNFVVLSINVKEDEQAVAQFAEALHLTMPVLLDRDGSMSRSYGVRGLPASILIDPEGMVREIRAGEINRAYIETQLAALGVLAALDLTTSTPALSRRESTATPGLTTPVPAASTPVSSLERVDLDEIFPLGEGQDLVIKTCLVCHEVFTFGVARRTEVEWLRNEANHMQEFTQLTDEIRPNDAQIEAMYEYMVANFNRDRPISKQIPPSFICGV